ncbi:hypothetical protein M3Y94_00706500 [Aphelenchoides besseyi]|nr:hypothetical protein M3Y94_00706500 [Aphelenchoides besseyi]
MTTTEEIDGVLGQIVSLCDVNDVIDLEVERIDSNKLYDLWQQLGLLLAALESTDIEFNLDRFLEAFYGSFRFSSTAECREIVIKNFEAVVILLGDSMIHFVPKILPKIEYYLHGADRFRCLSIVFDHFGFFLLQKFEAPSSDLCGNVPETSNSGDSRLFDDSNSNLSFCYSFE